MRHPPNPRSVQVNAVRGAGTKYVVLAGGLAYSSDLGQWLTYKPTDPAGGLSTAWRVRNYYDRGRSCPDCTWNTRDCPPNRP